MPARTATKAAKATPARPSARRAVKAAPYPVQPGDDDPNLPPELRGMYGPPQLSKARGAGTTGQDIGGELDFDTSQPPAEQPMEKLFSIDGTPYYIPIEFPVGYSIVYLDALDEGRDIAVGRVLKLAVGPAWERLRQLAMERPDLIQPHHLQRIMDIVLSKIMGTIEEAGEGN